MVDVSRSITTALIPKMAGAFSALSHVKEVETQFGSPQLTWKLDGALFTRKVTVTLGGPPGMEVKQLDCHTLEPGGATLQLMLKPEAKEEAENKIAVIAINAFIFMINLLNICLITKSLKVH